MLFILKYLSILVVFLIFSKIIYDALLLALPSGMSGRLIGQARQFNVKEAIHTALNSIYIKIVAWVILNRLIIAIVATLIYSFLENKPLDLLGHYDDIWLKWDAWHYLHIAEHGYPREGDLKNILVFYPAYPLLIRAFYPLFDNYFYSAVFVSNVALILSCCVLHKLVIKEFKSELVAKNSVIYLLVFPLSIFASTAYTESTFLLFSVCSFYCMRTQRWLLAGGFGMLAALTRNHGVLLFAPMAYEVMRTVILQYRSESRPTLDSVIVKIFSACLIPFGLFLYLVLNWYVSGDWFRFLEYQKSNWGQEAIFFASNVANIYDRIGDGSSMLALGTWLPAVVVFCFSLLMTAMASRILPTSYCIYSLCFLVVSFSPSWLLSGARYMFVLFPSYMVLAKMLENRREIARFVENMQIAFLVFVCIAFIKFNVY